MTLRACRVYALKFYLEYPLYNDGLLCLTLALGLHYGRVQLVPTTGTLAEVQNSLAGTAVSLTGFITAAFAIILTLRDRGAPTPGQSVSRLMRLLGGPYYARMSQVFQFAIIELLLVFSVLHLDMFAVAGYPSTYHLPLALTALLVIILVVVRCLCVLSTIVELDLDAAPRS